MSWRFILICILLAAIFDERSEGGYRFILICILLAAIFNERPEGSRGYRFILTFILLAAILVGYFSLPLYDFSVGELIVSLAGAAAAGFIALKTMGFIALKTKREVGLLILAPVFFMAISSWYIFYDNSGNHSGFDFLSFIPPLAVMAGFSLVAAKKSRWAWAALACNALAILFFIFINHFNIMLQYEKWTGRGMPDRPAWSRPGR